MAISLPTQVTKRVSLIKYVVKVWDKILVTTHLSGFFQQSSKWVLMMSTNFQFSFTSLWENFSETIVYVAVEYLKKTFMFSNRILTSNEIGATAQFYITVVFQVDNVKRTRTGFRNISKWNFPLSVAFELKLIYV